MALAIYTFENITDAQSWLLSVNSVLKYGPSKSTKSFANIIDQETTNVQIIFNDKYLPMLNQLLATDTKSKVKSDVIDDKYKKKTKSPEVIKEEQTRIEYDARVKQKGYVESVTRAKVDIDKI